MTRTTSIEWTERTWNLFRGCSRKSPGCGDSTGGGCYAERLAIRMSGPGKAYEGLVRSTSGGPRWTGKVRFVPEMLAAPLHWREPSMVFVNSMSDLFHRGFTNEEIAAAFSVMAVASQHTFQILTKCADRMVEWFAWVEGGARATGAAPTDVLHGVRLGKLSASAATDAELRSVALTALRAAPVWPLPNVWAGVSVESPDYYGRIDELRKVPAAVRWLSIEPMLAACPDLPLYGISWVVIGLESGPGARAGDVEWIRDVGRQCRRAGVPYFVKQLGRRSYDSAAPGAVMDNEARIIAVNDDGAGASHSRPGFVRRLRDGKGGDMAEWDRDLSDLRVRDYPTPGALSLGRGAA